MKSVTIKTYLSIILLALQVVAFSWRVLVPDILSSLGVGSIVYVLILVSFIPLVSITGWYGATLTFPVEHE
jgi:hypothetical protein